MAMTNSEAQKRSRFSKINPFKGRFPIQRSSTFRSVPSNVHSPAAKTAATWAPGREPPTSRDVTKVDGTTVDAAELEPAYVHSDVASDTHARIATPVGDLADDIVAIMEEHRIGLREGAKARYLPDHERERLVTSESICNALGVNSGDMSRWIWAEASKTFVITILAVEDRAKRLEAMQEFFKHNFRDSYLPVKNLWDLCKCGKKSSERKTPDRSDSSRHSRLCHGVHKRRLDCFHHSIWTTTAFRRFYTEQWGLLLQPFNAKIVQASDKQAQYELPIFVIDDDRLLPFLPSEQVENPTADGAFGVVQPARMLKEFQNAIDNPGHRTINIAIKTIRPSKTYEVEKEWWREVEAHKELGYLDKGHLVQALAAYQYRGEYCLLFEWATGGTLRSYWESEEYPGLSSDLILNHLKQLRGLTDTLQMIHNTAQAKKDHRDRSPTVGSMDSSRSGSFEHRRRMTATSEAEELSDHTEDEYDVISGGYPIRPSARVPPQLSEDPSTQVLPTFRIQGPDEEPARPPSPPRSDGGVNWRHGDIKPENILRFKTGASNLGTLKLADLGRAKRHTLVTMERPVLEKDDFRTKHYEPPDLYVGRSDKTMSRLFDVWSLGCVFFECIVWMLHGSDWLQTFETSKSAATQDQTPFWIPSDDIAQISPVIQRCFQEIFEYDPECRGNKSSAVYDLLRLVRDKMLVVDLPARTDTYEKGKRANTQTILRDLDAIIENSSNAEYLFTGNDRSGLTALPIPVVTVRPNTSADPPRIKEKQLTQNNFLTTHVTGNHGRSRTSLLNTYRNVLENKWQYDDDDSFALKAYSSAAGLYSPDCVQLKNQVLCKYCRGRNFRKIGVVLKRQVFELENETSCSLCKMLLARTSAAQLNSVATIMLLRTDAGLAVHTAEGEIGYNPHMRLCRSSANDAAFATQPSSLVPIGLPRLPDIDSAANFHLMNCWLKDCDGGHGDKHLDCVKHIGDFRPNRLLYVGSGGASSSYIVETATLEDPKEIRYLALSHPWGVKSEDNPRFVSNADNIAKHMEENGIPDNKLPRNFRDAVKVARSLAIKYVWIDALCVLQKTKTDDGDFQIEAKFMQDIFSSAYCVLAASSASAMSSGFLRGRGKPRRRDRQATEVNGVQSADELILCDSPDDFQRDVIDGPLSTRAWVLQERALARRTIFFTSNQIYWECSNGVRCESMSKLQNEGAALLGDSNFPAYVEQQTKGDRISLWKGLYTDYCRLQFSESTDKPLAISGLEQRLSRQFADVTAAGVFGIWRGRCLLWMRADDIGSLQPIKFENANPGAWNPPSWSFMAHVGGITYLNIPGGAHWEILDLTLKGNADTLWMYANQPPIFNAYARDFDERAEPDSDTWLLVYDNPALSRHGDKCVVVGSIGDKLYYVLVVRKAAEPKIETGKESYERVGAGYLPKEWIYGEKIYIAIV